MSAPSPAADAPSRRLRAGGARPSSQWQAELYLGLERIAGRTALARRRHRGPLGVQRPFYPEEDGTCHVILLHPPAGVVGGDHLSVDIDAGSGTQTLLTTPAATKLYRSDGRQASQVQRMAVAPGGRLEWLPQETIAFDGARVRLVTDVQLAADARFIGWDILCLGRPACNERFSHGVVEQQTSIEREGRLLWRERAVYRGADGLLDAPWGLSGQPVVGSMLCVTPRGRGLAQALRDAVASHAPQVAVSHLDEVLVVRYLGPSVEHAREAFAVAWALLRERLWGAPAEVPRIWLT